jgi:L-threonylcarbamoyladenylate synthase
MITTSIQKAVEALNKGEIVAIPTETVYGLAANIYNEQALKAVFSTKKRPTFNPLIVHIESINHLEKVAKNIPEIAYRLANAFWPGPLTLILEKQPEIPDLVTAGKPTVGVRVPNHPVTLQLLSKLDFPVAAPSANPFTGISSTTSQHVFDYFEKDLSVILDGGPCLKGVESTIVGFDSETVILYRHGAIAIEAIEKVVGQIEQVTSSSEIVAPGMLKLHYAPKTLTLFTNDLANDLQKYKDQKVGLVLFQNSIATLAELQQEVLSPNGSLEEAAKNLYAAFHRLDAQNLDIILVEKMPNHGLGKTINDRLSRAVQ